ncbi:capsular biosynthesis protein [Vibrio vulnificus]|nr:capsular biosynthesis protein [Vibrio vulnificus]EIZ1171830.1 capsular biosynthesis protein [Vibrio vulnificus]EKG2460210.1 capsular biosynthesis protein [Vibrio vulnificus]
MFLIMSGAYVGQELESEFGKIPPSFLPLGNRRLFQHQIALIPEWEDAYISIPESYLPSIIDIKWIESRGVEIIKTPDGLTLGASLIAALNISGHSLDSPLHILYGDTLYKELPIGDDIASFSYARDSYNWGVLTDDDANWLKDGQDKIASESPKIIDGYFKFSNPRELIKFITKSNWDFIEGLNHYHKKFSITPVESSSWFDFGHVNTYYRSKAEFTTQRAFNQLKITPQWIEKSSSKNDKIAAEANWFENLPNNLRGNIPQYLGIKVRDNTISYRLEYLYLTALNELFVFSKLPSHVWERILLSCIDFLLACKEHIGGNEETTNSIDILFNEKTADRLSEYCLVNGISLDKKWHFNNSNGISLSDLIEFSNKHLPCNNEQGSILHGDFCFSNILYDFRSNKIKTIDPRGMTPNGEKTIYGDFRYDLAKLSHSILGLYDWIIAGYYDIEINGSNIEFKIYDEKQYKDIQQLFVKNIEDSFGVTSRNLYAMQIQLFLSMLPLHSDNRERQMALFANAFRLHEILVRLEQ